MPDCLGRGHVRLARRGREAPADQDALEQAKQAPRNDWPSFLVLEVSQHVVEQAGEYADTFALRGYDSVQLAGAQRTLQRVQQPVIFACFDKRLCKAAKFVRSTPARFLSAAGSPKR